MKTKTLKPLSDPYIYRYHAATVGTDGRINENTIYSNYYWDKATVDRLVADDAKLKTITVIIIA